MSFFNRNQNKLSEQLQQYKLNYEAMQHDYEKLQQEHQKLKEQLKESSKIKQENKLKKELTHNLSQGCMKNIEAIQNGLQNNYNGLKNQDNFSA